MIKCDNLGYAMHATRCIMPIDGNHNNIIILLHY